MNATGEEMLGAARADARLPSLALSNTVLATMFSSSIDKLRRGAAAAVSAARARSPRGSRSERVRGGISSPLSLVHYSPSFLLVGAPPPLALLLPPSASPALRRAPPSVSRLLHSPRLHANPRLPPLMV